MAFKTVTEKPPRMVIPAGNYIVRCEKEPEEVTSEQYGPGVRWTLTLPDPDDEELVEQLKEHQQYPLLFTTPARYDKGSKTIQWAEAFNGRAFELGEEWWHLEGKSAVATITNRKPKNNPNGEVNHYIDALVPVKRRRRVDEETPAPKRRAAEESAADDF